MSDAVVLVIVGAMISVAIVLASRGDRRGDVPTGQALDSQAQAFAQAMTALESMYERMNQSNVEVLGKLVDMVHGPANDPDDLPPDRPEMDLRPSWMPDDEHPLITVDPTDDTMPDPIVEFDGDEGAAVSVRPGEGLLS